MNPHFCPDMINRLFEEDIIEWEPEIREYKWYWIDPETKEPNLITGWFKDEDELRKEYKDAPRDWFNRMWPTERLRG